MFKINEQLQMNCIELYCYVFLIRLAGINFITKRKHPKVRPWANFRIFKVMFDFPYSHESALGAFTGITGSEMYVLLSVFFTAIYEKCLLNPLTHANIIIILQTFTTYIKILYSLNNN